MAKIGRNDACPCGSGMKYKRCCLQKNRPSDDSSSMRQLKISLVKEIEKIQLAAQQREEVVRELGVFILWSNPQGDAWLLEISESDCVQVASDGKLLEVPIDENPSTIEIDWSHTFAVRDRKFYITAYADKVQSCIETAPVKRINAAIRRIRKKYPAEVLDQVHINPQEIEKTGT